MKKTLKHLTLTLAVAALLLSLTACGKKAGDDSNILKFGTNAEFAPFTFVSGGKGVVDGFDGIDICILKRICEDNGFTPAVENMEFDSLLIALENKQVDVLIGGITITEEKKEKVNFSIPYYTATQVMIVPENSDITSAADMADKRIAVVQGYTGEVCIKQLGFKYSAFKNGSDAIVELTNGKCDVVVLDSATAKNYIQDNNSLKIIEDTTAFEKEEYGIAVPKESTELLEKINASIRKMIDDGSIAAWEKQYTELN